jgi:hypothetical protein
MAVARRLPSLPPGIGRFAAGVTIIAAMVWGPGVYGTLTAGNRIAPALKSADGPVNVRVTLSFRPGTFQRQVLSEYGIFGGIRGNSVVLFNVSPAGLRHLDDLYWVDGIEPLRSQPDEGS